MKPSPALDAAAAGHHPGRRRFSLVTAAGPAVVASIAYIDPGNIAANLQAGARHGGALLVVVLAANLLGMLFQALSARLGIVTGRNLAELSREHFPRGLVYLMWIASELAAMATDVAELTGGAIGFALLFDIPLVAGMGICAALAYGVLLLQHRNPQPIAWAVGGTILFVGLCYAAQIGLANEAWHIRGISALVPDLGNRDEIMLTVAIIGATVMPHAIYLHSALAQASAAAWPVRERPRLVRISNAESIVALGFAGAVNMAMVMLAATAFHDGRHEDVATIDTAYHTLKSAAGNAVAAFFLAALIGSGVASSIVGTMAGQVIMQGFVGFRIPLWLRRLVTMAPAFAVALLVHGDLTAVLVLSQIVLSIALPVPILALLWLSRRKAVMGAHAISRGWQGLSGVAALAILGLNAVLILQSAGLAGP